MLMMIDVELLSGTGGVIMIVFAALIGHLNTVRKLHGQKVTRSESKTWSESKTRSENKT